MSRCLPLLLASAAAVGCADARLFCRPPAPEVTQAGYTADALPGPPEYRLGCADVVAVTVVGRPDLDCYASVGIDGRLALGPLGDVAAEGLGVEEVRRAVAELLGEDAGRVAVTLADPRAGRVYLSGPEADRQQAVPYRGPERVVDFLWRVGAMKQGSTDVADVSVVRPNVAAGLRPQVFRVDVAAAVLDGDHSTNVWLRPSDQVVVGETRRSWFSRRLPAWLRPLYRKLVGVLPPDGWPWAPADRRPW